MLLPVAVATSNSLFDALRIPRQIVVHHQRAELKIDAFRARFGGYHNAALFTEIIHERRADVGRHLSAECSEANRFEPAFQCFEDLFLTEIGELFPETLKVAEDVLVN